MRARQYSVFPRDAGWCFGTAGADLGVNYRTQADAAAAARRVLELVGGGELTIHGEHGRIRSKDTVGAGNDPASIKDTEH